MTRTGPQWHWQPWRDGGRGEAVGTEDAARAWLGPLLRCAPADVVLQRDPHGRPRLGPGHGADTGWSHSGDGLLFAFGRGVVLGVDLEIERPRPKALEIAQRHFAPAESRWLDAHAPGGARDLAFVRLWCAKEAVLKAHGRGLAFGLDRVVFAERGGALVLVEADAALGDAQTWSLREFVPHPGYRAALAWRPA
jgi:4'-phosphopantetheinyl transferase